MVLFSSVQDVTAELGDDANVKMNLSYPQREGSPRTQPAMLQVSTAAQKAQTIHRLWESVLIAVCHVTTRWHQPPHTEPQTAVVTFLMQ